MTGILGLLHIGVYTRDLSQSIAFYRDLLGFAVTWQGVVDHPTGKLPVATVACGDCVIELVQPADLSRVHPQDGAVQHIALRVLDLDWVVSELACKGIELDEGISKISYEGGIRHCFIRGPSHERIELGEYTSSN